MSQTSTNTAQRYYSAATLYTALLTACIFLVTLVNIGISTWQQNVSIRSTTLDQANAVGLLVASGSANGVVFNQRELLERAATGVESLSGFEWIIIRNSTGDTLYTKNLSLAPETFRQGATIMPQNTIRTVEQENGTIIVAAPVHGPVEADRRGEVILALNTTALQSALNRSRVAMIASGLGAAVVLALFCIIVVRLMGKTAQKHVEVANRVTQGDLSRRVSEKFTMLTSKETVVIRRAFNRMLDSLEQGQEEMRIKNERLQDATTKLLQLNAQLDNHAKEVEEKNRQIEAQNNELQEMNVEKNEFLGIVAHDLKNPISSFQGLAAVLGESAENPDTVRQISDVMMQSASKMFELVRNLLDVNQLERGGRKYDMQPINAAWILMPVVESYMHKAEEKGITIHCDPPEQSLICFADSLALSQVLDNLVSNAVKYSPHDKNIWVEFLETPATVRIAIRDEGPGLSDDDKAKLFGKFARLSAQPTGGEHSTGLGLSIVKKMVETMNGRVWCESELGKGATFFVEFSRTPTANS
ncbi:MAG: ATP-binding protein [Candidatus Kapaibacteriota bacterium]